MSNRKIPSNPLTKIGLSLSGGGYRAASFHLGAMSYLNHLIYKEKPLLENVKLISTVSGGTITGIIYALRKQRGESFQEIYKFILDKLRTLDLVREGIEKLNPDSQWSNNYKQKNFINAFAELYDRDFTEGQTFKVFNKMNSHLEAVVFNSTEFNNGINFRFRDIHSGIFGNYKIQIPVDAAEEVKLSDAMASSSCFTGGFEPMIWPNDFLHDKAENLKKLKPEPLGLMDGGIYDNQGVESILNYKKNSQEPYFDLIIISDVTSPYMNGYKPADSNPKNEYLKLSLHSVQKKVNRINTTINVVLICLIIISALLPLSINGAYLNTMLSGACLGISATLFILFLGKSWAVNYGNKIIQKLLLLPKKVIGTYFTERFSNLKIEELPFWRVLPLVLDRLNSLYTLFMDVFLKVVRRLNYYKLYSDDKYQYRRITNLIQELTEQDFTSKSLIKKNSEPSPSAVIPESKIKGEYQDIVGNNIKKIAEEVASFGTTLWFTEQNELSDTLNKLVASGQFTMCYNMISYLEPIIFEKDNGFSSLDPKTKEDLKNLYFSCLSDWELFKKSPMIMA